MSNFEANLFLTKLFSFKLVLYTLGILVLTVLQGGGDGGIFCRVLQNLNQEALFGASSGRTQDNERLGQNYFFYFSSFSVSERILILMRGLSAIRKVTQRCDVDSRSDFEFFF